MQAIAAHVIVAESVDELAPHLPASSFDAFDLLYTGRGLPVDEVARLLVTTAERTVCRQPPRRPGGGDVG